MRSVTPGRKPSMRPSACSTIFSTASTPSGFFRSIPIDRRLRVSVSFGGSAGSPPRTAPARSTRMTLAPMSASIMAQNGPGPIPASSMMVIPSSGPIHSP